MSKLSNYLFESSETSINVVMATLFEDTQLLNEDARIQHAEDVIFWEGSRGVKRVLESFLELQKEGYKNLTIKWDGSPAVVFGRNQAGQFVLTDKGGFFAKGYQGKVTSPEELEKMFLARSGGAPKSDSYKAFAGSMKNVFSIFESAVPKEFRGYFKGDLLYFTRPPIQHNKFVFKPNIVTYHVDVNSELGKKINKSVAAVVVHRYIDEAGNESQISNFNIFQGDNLLVIPPITIQKAPVVDNKKIKDTLALITNHGASIDKMLSSSDLSQLKLTDFPDTLYKYINSKVDTGLSNLGKDFTAWLETGSKLTGQKQQRMSEYINQHRATFDALWLIVGNVMDIKEAIVAQVDQQNLPIKAYIGNIPSGEGYVLSHPSGDIKFVSRPIFAAVNRAVQRETVNEGGWLNPTLTSKTAITPQIVEGVFANVEKFVEHFNQHLSNKKLNPIEDFKILGSAKYYKQDIADKIGAQYGDIDVMFVLPEVDDETKEAKTKTLYSKLIVDFIVNTSQDYIDKESAKRSGGKQIIIKINESEWAQIDLLFTFKRYGEWFSTRFSPQRGLKGFVIGNLYSSLADILNIRVSDRGVRARIKDGQITNPLLRKGVIDKLISTNPSTFLFDIFLFLAEMFDVKYTTAMIDNRLSSHKGVNSSNIKFEDLAIGIAGLAKTLENSGILEKLGTTHSDFINKIKSTYAEKTAEQIELRSKKVSDDDTAANLEKVKKDAAIGAKSTDKFINEFTETFKEYLTEGGAAVEANSKMPRKYLESTVKNGLKLYKLSGLTYNIIGNKQKEILGDIDVATSVRGLEELLKVSYDVDKKEFYKKLEDFFGSNTPSSIPRPAYKIISGLDQVSINVPIVDEHGIIVKSTEYPDKDGYVQLDLMIGDVDFMGKALSGAPDSKYKAALRNLLLMNIMRYSYEPTSDPNVRVRYQFNWKKGLQKLDVVTDAKGKEQKTNIKTISNDMDDVAVFLFGANHTFNDINTFEKLFKLVGSTNFRYKKYKNEIIDDFKNEIKKLGFEL